MGRQEVPHPEYFIFFFYSIGKAPLPAPPQETQFPRKPGYSQMFFSMSLPFLKRPERSAAGLCGSPCG